jgi:hypothetical protein
MVVTPINLLLTYFQHKNQHWFTVKSQYESADKLGPSWAALHEEILYSTLKWLAIFTLLLWSLSHQTHFCTLCRAVSALVTPRPPNFPIIISADVYQSHRCPWSWSEVRTSGSRLTTPLVELVIVIIWCWRISFVSTHDSGHLQWALEISWTFQQRNLHERLHHSSWKTCDHSELSVVGYTSYKNIRCMVQKVCKKILVY